jgi:hypothetical protein
MTFIAGYFRSITSNICFARHGRKPLRIRLEAKVCTWCLHSYIKLTIILNGVVSYEHEIIILNKIL